MYDEGRPTQPVWSEQDASFVAYGKYSYSHSTVAGGLLVIS